MPRRSILSAAEREGSTASQRDVCASAAQLCGVEKPCSTPWHRKAFIGSCK